MRGVLDRERSSRCIQIGREATYVVKTVNRRNGGTPACVAQAEADLATEAHLLSGIDHPNIIRLRGMVVDEDGGESFSLVFDRLYDTLDQRKKTWKKRRGKSHVRNTFAIFKESSSQEQKLMDERVGVCFNLADALKFLHGRQ